jgi:uncharacterized protein (DUF58 family)
MIDLEKQSLLVPLRIYIAIALVVAAIFSPLPLSSIPLALLALYLYLWWRPISAISSLLLNYFLFFALAILFQPTVGNFFPLLISVPVLVPVNHALLQTSATLRYQESDRNRSPTSICIIMFLIPLVILVISALLGNLTLALACLISASYLGILLRRIIRDMPLKPVEEMKIQQRMVAGTKTNLQLRLNSRCKVGGILFVESSYEWLKLRPTKLPLNGKELQIDVFLSPPLSGPSTIKFRAHAIDQWGLTQLEFEIEPLSLHIIPRARYAAWLARKYLDEAKAGSLMLASLPTTFKKSSLFRTGIEYYGSRPYQPGDSLRHIDWKHSVKLNELVTKEFSQSRGQSAMMLTNLAVSDDEEADKLAYKIIVTAISLAQEGIPVALAAYDHEDVRLTTTPLKPRELVVRSLELTQQIVTFINPVKYLSPPDIARLRANISRIKLAQSEASRVLLQLLQLEYRTLDDNARLNPATKTLLEALAKEKRQMNIVLISHHNHDAEALAFDAFSFASKGHAVIEL